MPERSPTVRERRLGAQLRHLCEIAGLNLDQVIDILGWSEAKLSRVETARSGVKTPDLHSLLDLYEVSAERRGYLLTLARRARERGWWDAYAGHLPTDYAACIELEAEAASLRCYDAVLLHRLLQTEAYAREVIRSALMQFRPPTEVDRRVEVRMTRQAVPTKRDPTLRFWTVIDENALRRRIGGPELMRAQGERLMELAGLPNVMIQVLPHGAGAHPGVAGTFSVLEFPERYVPDVGYVETITGALYTEDETEVHTCCLAFDQIRAMALGPDESLAMIERPTH